MMRLVILESPFAAKTEADLDANVDYARACMRDCLARGEAPFASHLLYTQPNVLRDGEPSERALGMQAGVAWIPASEGTVVYIDRGISRGMRAGVTVALSQRKPIEIRSLLGPVPPATLEEFRGVLGLSEGPR